MAARLLALLAGITVLAACTIEHGVRPNFGNLAQLTTEKSSKSDVQRALGVPTGKGAAHFPDDHRIREIWSYEYTRTAMPNTEVRFLLVFFRDQRFDGYMWFSSNALVGSAP